MEEVIFNTKTNLPQPSTAFKLIRALPGLLYFSPLRKWIERRLANVEESRVTSGFFAIVGANIHAKNVYLNDTIFLDYARIDIGDGTVFSGENTLITSSHDLNDFSIVRARPITIGRNVWITHRCIILGGVNIGDNSVIGAGSVVTNDIPSNVLAAGNPCRVIKAIQRG